jgi:hypothetical protein
LDKAAAKKLHEEMNKVGYVFATMKDTLSKDSTWKKCAVHQYTDTDTVAK